MSIFKRKVSSKIRQLLIQFPQDTQNLLDKIPGLEDIGEILKRWMFSQDLKSEMLSKRLCASVLRVAFDFDFYEEQGHDKQLIISTLQNRPKDYDPHVITALKSKVMLSESNTRLEEISVKKLSLGMRLIDELRMADGFLVASSGAYIDGQLYKVIRNYLSCFDNNLFLRNSGAGARS